MDVVVNQITVTAKDTAEAQRILKLLDTRTKAEREPFHRDIPAMPEPVLAARWRTQVAAPDGRISMTLEGAEIAEFSAATGSKYSKAIQPLQSYEPGEPESPVAWSDPLATEVQK